MFHIRAAITLEGKFPLGPGENHPEGTEHDACPAGDAAIFPNDHQVTFRIPGQRPAGASVQAGRFNTLAALDRKASVIGSLDAKTRFRDWRLLDCFRKCLAAASPFDGTVQFAGLTACAAVQVNSNYFHEEPLCSRVSLHGDPVR